MDDAPSKLIVWPHDIDISISSFSLRIYKCSYRGDIVNGLEFSEISRQNDPYRMLSAYHQSAQASPLETLTQKDGMDLVVACFMLTWAILSDWCARFHR